ncbi:MAG: relaxase domain-containing protein [Micropruina sp.]|nr:MAG: relaxase domain-containing protein [Micropruina sp.]
MPDEVKAQLRTELGREFFVHEFGRQPTSERELLGAIVRWSKAAPVTVAGFDLSFSPSKSVSTLWALADPQVAALIERCHQAAVRASLDHLEHHALYTRLGTDGVQQVDVQGMVGVWFTHRDSRAGDPDLHAHVAIANKVQTLDGRWRAVDARLLYQAHVAASEVYDTTLMAQLGEVLGVRLVPRQGRGKNPVWEIDGVDPELCKAWSSRRTEITQAATELAATFRANHGRQPTQLEMIHLAQQANLDTRQAKHEPRTLAEQRATWRQQAEALLSAGGIEEMLGRTFRRAPVATFQPTPAWTEQVATTVVEALEASRATWRETHVRAEVLRQIRGLPIPTDQLTSVVDRLVDAVLTGHSWSLEPASDGVDEPAVLRRLDGQSVYTVAGSITYSSGRIMAAEQRLLATAARTDGRRIDPALVDLALLESTANGVTLNHGQADLVRDMATSGRRIQLAIAPAGTGKTTALAVLRQSWAASGGQVVGLAPSAAAADVLREHLGGTCDTLAKLAHSLTHPETAPAWVRTIGPDTLVIIDEAGMADTPTLDLVTSHVASLGGSVRLVGDDHQLTAVAAGGILADIATTHGALRLDEVLRFDDPGEAAATLALRRGDPNAIGFYADNNRLHPADAANIGSQVLTAWYADRHRGLDAIMLAPTRDLVAQLNQAARAAASTASRQAVKSRWPTATTPALATWSSPDATTVNSAPGPTSGSRTATDGRSPRSTGTARSTLGTFATTGQSTCRRTMSRPGVSWATPRRFTPHKASQPTPAMAFSPATRPGSRCTPWPPAAGKPTTCTSRPPATANPTRSTSTRSRTEPSPRFSNASSPTTSRPSRPPLRAGRPPTLPPSWPPPWRAIQTHSASPPSSSWARGPSRRSRSARISSCCGSPPNLPGPPSKATCSSWPRPDTTRSPFFATPSAKAASTRPRTWPLSSFGASTTHGTSRPGLCRGCQASPLGSPTMPCGGSPHRTRQPRPKPRPGAPRWRRGRPAAVAGPRRHS